MAKRQFIENGSWSPGFPSQDKATYRTLAYEGDLGGGTLSLSCEIDGVTAPVPDSKLTAATVDDNGDAIKSFPFRTSGRVIVTLSGATNPNVTVAVL